MDTRVKPAYDGRECRCTARAYSSSLRRADGSQETVDLSGAVRGLLHVAGDLACRRSLLSDGLRDGIGDLVDFGDGPANRLDRADGFAGRGLNALDLRRNFLRRLRGLI